jgi:hypothetical protein
MADEIPDAAERFYLPEPSYDPALLAIGLGLLVAGLFVWTPYGVIGAVLAIAATVRMLRETSDDVGRLPRRQKLTTAVLPAVPPRKPGA